MLPDLAKVQRVLIVRLSSIGDVVHALPVSAALKDAYPHLELTWLVEEMSAEVVAGNPCLRDVLVIPRKRWKAGRFKSPRVWREYLAFLAELRQRRFDVTLDLQGYGKSALYVLATGAKWKLGWFRQRDGAGLVSKAIPKRPESVHRVDWFLDVARALEAVPNPVRFPLHVPDMARERVRELLCASGIDAGRPYAVLNPAVGSETRRWGAARYAELAVGLWTCFGLPSILIGSGKDVSICDEVRQLARTRLEAERLAGAKYENTVLSLAGQTSLKELAAVLDGSAVHVCGDTGSAHTAAALGVPVVALYGPTDPEHAGPWAQAGNVLSHRQFCQSGCSVRQCVNLAVTGEGATRTATACCLADITPQEVLDKVGQVLEMRRGVEAVEARGPSRNAFAGA